MASAGEAHLLHVYMHMYKIARRVRQPCTAGLDPERAPRLMLMDGVHGLRG